MHPHTLHSRMAMRSVDAVVVLQSGFTPFPFEVGYHPTI